jgi:DNA invertase Pin-like site-specific DNA recombinase
MRAALYARVSTEVQTVQNQLFPLKDYAERMGYEYDIFQEQESSRKTRPVKNELYQKLLRKEYDVLIIYKFDRWARSTKELVTEMELLVKRGVSIHSLSEGFDLNTSMGQAMLTIISAFAQLERDIIRERTMAGLERAKRTGKTLGRPMGAKDKSNRRKSGYFLRHAKEAQKIDKKQGIYRDIEEYLNKTP